MAELKVFECTNCGKTIESWSDGNPYYFDLDTGEKKYAYHPNHTKLELCMGNDEEHICLSCGHELKIDDQDPISQCPQCSSEQLSSTFSLDEKDCPFCKNGTFKYSPERGAVS